MNSIIGDSHIRHVEFKNSVNLRLGAGSAKGLNNPNSISQYNKRIIEHIRENNYQHHFFLFGGVDVDFCFIHKYLENPEINFIEFNLDVIKNYLNFINTNFTNKSVIILSVGLPCLDDDNLKKGLLNGHINHLENKNLVELEDILSQANLPNIYKRTKITLNFNKQLEREIRHMNNPNIQFIDITSFTYDENLKRIKNDFFTRVDHHNVQRNSHFTSIINDFLNKI
jgi:hypothetical protein